MLKGPNKGHFCLSFNQGFKGRRVEFMVAGIIEILKGKINHRLEGVGQSGGCLYMVFSLLGDFLLELFSDEAMEFSLVF